jgi:DNA-binding MarR family transcriptional regulator
MSCITGKRSYSHVKMNQRMELIGLLENKDVTIKEIADQLCINYSTAKHIVKQFQKTGNLETS